MSILLHQEILEKSKRKWYRKKRIHISPFSEKNIGPNSYDVRLAPTIKMYKIALDDSAYLDPKKPNETELFEIPEEGIILKPGVLYLGSTMEEVGSDYYIPMYEGRSSMARLGIQSHISAGFGDVGFKSKWTLEIQVIHPVKVYPGMRIGQVYFHRVNWKANKKKYRYQGKYVSQGDPQESRSYLDPEYRIAVSMKLHY